ncbi:hypothetical protein ACRRTK_015479 [Alexandromys fortis]
MRGTERRGENGYGPWEAWESCCIPLAFWTAPDTHNSCLFQDPRLDVKQMPPSPSANSVETMASLMPLSPYLSPTVLLLVSCDLGFVRAATERPFGQRVIREVNTTTRACALWSLAENSDYTMQVRSIGLRGASPPGPLVHFRTLKGSDRLPSNSSSPGDITVEGLDGEQPLQTGEVVIIVVVLLTWAAVIGLFCLQYDIIKDNDSNNNPKEKGKGPEQSPQGRPVGTRQVTWGPVSVRRVIWVPRSIQ